MKKMTSIFAGIVVAAMAFAVPTAANADTLNTVPPGSSVLTEGAPTVPDVTVLDTGNYEYNCVLTDGSSYFMGAGEPLTNCKGSYLQKYLDGRQLTSVSLAYGGGAQTTIPGGAGWCLLAVGSAVSLLVFPPTTATAWVVNGALAGGGLTSCLDM